MNDETKDVILGVFEAYLHAQLRAVRRLRHGPPGPAEPPRRKGLLKKARSPLHVSQILDRIHTQFGLTIDREILVSSLSKKVARAAIASSTPRRIPLPCDRRPDDLALCIPFHYPGLARGLPPAAHLPARRAAGLASLVCPGRRCLTRIIWPPGAKRLFTSFRVVSPKNIPSRVVDPATRRSIHL